MATIAIETIRPNLTRVQIGHVNVWFSYTTPIAFSVHGVRYVCENVWTVTTGKHLNEIDGGNKADRVHRAEFLALLERLSMDTNTDGVLDIATGLDARGFDKDGNRREYI